MAAEIEKRLAALEKRARTDDIRWQMLDADLKAFRIIIECIGRPVCAANPALTPIIIKNLKAFEDDARLLNLHSSTVSRLRGRREYFEQVSEKISRPRLPSGGAGPRHAK